jgi:hypothetical protein
MTPITTNTAARYFESETLTATETTAGLVISNISQLSGKMGFLILGCDIAEFVNAFYHWSKGLLIQDAFPWLTPDEREFIKTGITPEEWKAAFGDFE